MKTKITFLSTLLLVFSFNFGFTQDWNQLGPELVGSSDETRIGFGVTINGEGNIAAYVSPNTNGDGNVGSVTVLELNGNTWNQLGNTFPGGFGNSRGFSGIDLNDEGDRLAVSIGSGDVNVYQLTGGNWQLLGNTIPPVGSAGFQKVDFDTSGNTLAVGYAFGQNGEGSTAVFELQGNVWVQKGSVLIGDNQGDSFGRDVSLNADGTRLAVGAAQVDSNFYGFGVQQGYVKVFQFQGGEWVQLGSNLDGEGLNVNGDQFGKAVNLNGVGNRLITGTNAYAKVYDLVNDSWLQVGSRIDEQSYQVDINSTGNLIVLGGFTQPTTILEWRQNSWQEFGQTIFGIGQDVAMNNAGNIIIGGNPDANNFFGKVAIFEYTGALVETQIMLDTNGALTISDTNGGDTNDNFTLALNGGNLRISNSASINISGSGAVQIDPNTVEIPLSSITNGITLDGASGANTLLIDAALNLLGPDNGLTLNNIDVTIAGGTAIELNALQVNNGSFDTTGGVITVVTAANIDTGSTLSGTGTIIGVVNMNVDSNLAPGVSPGILNTGDLTLDNNNNDFEVDGPTPGTEHDQIVVTGTVTIVAGTTLNLLNGYANGANTEIVLIQNDGTDPINGTFDNFAEGASVSFGDFNGKISYAGGDGNDLVLLDNVPTDREPPVAVCQDFTVELDGNGMATVSVSDIDNGSSDDTAIAAIGLMRMVALDYEQNVVPDAIFGSGNANGGFTVNQAGTVELGLRAKVRYPTPANTFNSNGDGTYAHLAGAGTPASRALWNFEWSVNTDPMGTAGTKLDGLTYEMGMDFDPSLGTDYFVFDPINQPVADHAIGDNTTANGDGTVATDNAAYAALLAGNNVAQNSWNLDFFNELAGKAFDPTVDGTYDIYLKAMDGTGAVVGETLITVIVGNGGGVGTLPQTVDFTEADLGTNTVVLTVVDEAGNRTICTATVTVESAADTTPPVAVCQDFTVELDGNGMATVSVSDIDNGSSDDTAIAAIGLMRMVALDYEQNVVPDAIFGSGNANGGFTVNQAGTVELGLRAKVRYPTPANTFNSNGDGTYAHLAGAGTPASRALWNFEWSVNTDPMGTAGTKLDGLTYEMGMDFDPSLGTDYFVFDPINQPVADHAIGDNTTANGDGTVATDNAAYAALLAGNNVAQNSWNLDFFNELAGKAFDPTVDGTYDIYLKAMDGTGAVVGETLITVIVGNGGGVGTLPQTVDFTEADLGTNTVVLTVVDEAGNRTICTATVTVKSACEVAIVEQPQDAEICAGDPLSFDIGATGNGTLSYQWQVDTGTGFEDLGVPSASSPLNFAFMQIGGDGNQYRVIATSDNGTPNDATDDCSATSEAATLTVNPAPMVEITGNDSYCHDGDGVVLDAGAGFASYLWSPTGETTRTITALEGSYTVEVTNATGCATTSEAFMITKNEALACSINQEVLTTDHLTQDGVATVNVTGGSGQYTYLWDNGETTQTATTLTYGMHSVTVTDSNGCETSCQVDIAKELYCWTSVVQNVTVSGGSDGAARVSGNGGYRPFTFQWEDGTTGAANNRLSAGVHYVTITDATGATSRCSVAITEPMGGNCDSFMATVAQEKLTTDHLTRDGVATVYPQRGTAPFTYLWDNGETTQTATRLTYGLRTVTVTDANGCETGSRIDIAKELYCWINLNGNVGVHGGNDGSATVLGNGGYRPFTYRWDDGSTQQLNSNLGAGTHYVTITDATGATSRCSITIYQPNEEVCDGVDNDGDGMIDEGFDQDGDGVADCFDICDKGDDNVDMDMDGIPDACDDTICIKDDMPMTECYETAEWNEQTCSWDIVGEMPMEPVTECYETAVWNATTCSWDIVDGQPEMPVTECYETAEWNEQTCSWDVVGEMPMEPVTECYKTAVWNATTCSWEIVEGQPEMPVTECYETAEWNEQTCSWDVVGEMPMEPVTECYQTATFNTQTCEWDVIGEQPEMPVTECYETAVWNEQTCEWDIIENGNDADGDGFCSDVDCDDNNPDVFPGATEVCDGVDNNCVGGIDEGLDCNTGGIDQCETAFARSADENVRTCFLDIPNVSGNRWGWVNEFPSINGTYEMEVYAAAGQCDISKGALVGNVQVIYTNGSVDVTVTTLSGYKMTEAQLHVGSQILPTQGNGFTTAPGQYPYADMVDGDFTTYTFEGISAGDADNFYVVFHANVCPLAQNESLAVRRPVDRLVLKAYPVPFKENVNLNVIAPRNMEGTLSLFNGIGQKVKDFGQRSLRKGDNAVYLDTGELPVGTYFVRMNSILGNETLQVIRK